MECGTSAEFFDNSMLRKIFWTMKQGATEGWREIHNEEVQDLYPAPEFSVVKPRKM